MPVAGSIAKAMMMLSPPSTPAAGTVIESEVPVVLLEDVPIARTSEIAARAERPGPNGGTLAIAAMARRTARGRLRPMADRGRRDLAVATRGARLTRVKDEFQAEHHPVSPDRSGTRRAAGQ